RVTQRIGGPGERDRLADPVVLRGRPQVRGELVVDGVVADLVEFPALVGPGVRVVLRGFHRVDHEPPRQLGPVGATALRRRETFGPGDPGIHQLATSVRGVTVSWPRATTIGVFPATSATSTVHWYTPAAGRVTGSATRA